MHINKFWDFFLYCSTAKKHLTELQKRLDTTERTMHLVMKQMEAVTKCLAKTLADDPAMSGDKSLAEITEGLVNLKESNVWAKQGWKKFKLKTYPQHLHFFIPWENNGF